MRFYKSRRWPLAKVFDYSEREVSRKRVRIVRQAGDISQAELACAGMSGGPLSHCFNRGFVKIKTLDVDAQMRKVEDVSAQPATSLKDLPMAWRVLEDPGAPAVKIPHFDFGFRRNALPELVPSGAVRRHARRRHRVSLNRNYRPVGLSAKIYHGSCAPSPAVTLEAR